MKTVLLWAFHRLGEHASQHAQQANEERAKPILQQNQQSSKQSTSNPLLPSIQPKPAEEGSQATSAGSSAGSMSHRYVFIEMLNYSDHRLTKPSYVTAEGETTMPPSMTVLTHSELPHYPWTARFQAKPNGPSYGCCGCLLYQVENCQAFDTDHMCLAILFYNPEDYVTRRQGNKYALKIYEQPIISKDDARIVMPRNVYQESLHKRIWTNANTGKVAQATSSSGHLSASAFMGDADQATLKIEIWCTCQIRSPLSTPNGVSVRDVRNSDPKFQAGNNYNGASTSYAAFISTASPIPSTSSSTGTIVRRRQSVAHAQVPPVQDVSEAIATIEADDDNGKKASSVSKTPRNGTKSS